MSNSTLGQSLALLNRTVCGFIAHCVCLGTGRETSSRERHRRGEILYPEGVMWYDQRVKKQSKRGRAFFPTFPQRVSCKVRAVKEMLIGKR